LILAAKLVSFVANEKNVHMCYAMAMRSIEKWKNNVLAKKVKGLVGLAPVCLIFIL